jgi:hypothetical protein
LILFSRNYIFQGFVESKRAERVKEVSQLEDNLKVERACNFSKPIVCVKFVMSTAGSSADKDVVESKARVAELQAALQVSTPASHKLFLRKRTSFLCRLLLAAAGAKARGAAGAGAAVDSRTREFVATIRS